MKNTSFFQLVKNLLSPQAAPVAVSFDNWLGDGAQGTFVAKAKDFPEGRFDLAVMLFSGPWSRKLRQARRCLCAYLGSLGPVFGWKVFWYRLAGVIIGRNVCLAPGVVLDMLTPQIISIGDEAVLGMGSMINSHLYTPERIFFGRVQIGEYGVVGARAMVGNSVTVEPHGVIGSLSFFFNGVVPERALAIGVPAVIRLKEERRSAEEPGPEPALDISQKSGEDYGN